MTAEEFDSLRRGYLVSGSPEGFGPGQGVVVEAAPGRVLVSYPEHEISLECDRGGCREIELGSLAERSAAVLRETVGGLEVRVRELEAWRDGLRQLAKAVERAIPQSRDPWVSPDPTTHALLTLLKALAEEP